MCRKTTCRNCQKPSWAGCGAHVEQVLAEVAPADRCTCTTEERRRAGWISRLLRR